MNDDSPERPVELVAIINSFNRRALLERAVASLAGALRSARVGSAVIVFEAGSNDGSAEFLSTWRENHPVDNIFVIEAAADVLRDSGHIDPAQVKRVCQEIALLHYMDTLMEHGEQIAQDSLKKNPAKMITLINACCNSSNATIAIEKQKLRLQERKNEGASN